jgi:hypothetical protein
MVSRLTEPVRRLEMLMPPATPPHTDHITYGYRHDKGGNWTMTDYGRDHAAVTQRILLRYALGYETRAELARRYSLSERNIQDILAGDRSHWFTAPIRERLMAHGIGNARMNRSPKGSRVVEVKQAIERLAGFATDMLVNRGRWTDAEIQEVATDLFLLSGAWREDEE